MLVTAEVLPESVAVLALTPEVVPAPSALEPSPADPDTLPAPAPWPVAFPAEPPPLPPPAEPAPPALPATPGTCEEEPKLFSER